MHIRRDNMLHPSIPLRAELLIPSALSRLIPGMLLDSFNSMVILIAQDNYLSLGFFEMCLQGWSQEDSEGVDDGAIIFSGLIQREFDLFMRAAFHSAAASRPFGPPALMPWAPSAPGRLGYNRSWPLMGCDILELVFSRRARSNCKFAQQIELYFATTSP